MTLLTSDRSIDAKATAEALFAKLGLHVADERPILERWRKANSEWRQERRRRVAMHSQRIQDHLRRFKRPIVKPALAPRATMGRARAVWCIELSRSFRTLSDAAAFVNRSPSNIRQAVKLGIRCGPYHWEVYDGERHG